MRTKFVGLVATIAVLAAGVPMIAHHSFAAEFAATKAVKLTGAVTKIEWLNPHTYFYIDVSEVCTGTPPAQGQGAPAAGAAAAQTARERAPGAQANGPEWGP